MQTSQSRIEATRTGQAARGSKAYFLLPAFGAVAFALVIAAWRARYPALPPAFLAEDGPIFFQQQFVDGWSSLLRPYAGYFTTFQRVAALAVAPLGSPLAPTAYFAAWCVALAWSVWTIARANVPLAAVYAAAVMLTPQNGNLIATLTNVQWFLATAMIFVVSTPSPVNRAGRLNQLAIVAASGLSGPFVFFALPVAIARLFVRNDAHARLIAGIVGLTSIIQATAVVLTYSSPLPTSGGDPPLALVRALDRWFGQFVHGGRTDSPLDILLVALLVAVILWVLIRYRDEPLFIGTLVFACGVVLAGWLKQRHVPNVFFDGFANDRYFVIPRTILMWILIRAVASQSFITLPAMTCLIAMAVNYPYWYQRDRPRTPWEEPARILDRGGGMHFTVNPIGGGWIINIPPGTPNRTGR